MLRVVPIVLMLLASGAYGMVASAGPRAESRSSSPVGQGKIQQAADIGAGRAIVSEISPDLIRKALQKHLESQWGRRVKTVQVTVLDPAEPVTVPGGTVEVQVVPNPTEDSPGRRMFHVEAVTNEKSRKTIQVMADITVMVDAVVTTRFLKVDEPIEETDLKTVAIRVHQVTHPFVIDQAEVIGKSASRPLPPDTPLRLVFVKSPMVIKKGDRVVIEARRGGLSIRASGVTKSSGQLGQTIMVANVDSGRELRAKVVAPSLVEVEF